MTALKPRLVILPAGLRSAQPAAASVAVGALYFVTDEGVVERNNGTAWTAYSAAAVSLPTFTAAAVPFANALGVLTEDPTKFVYDNPNDTLRVPTVVGGTGTTDDLHLKATTGAGTTASRIFLDVGNNGAIPAVEIKPDAGGNFGQMGVGTSGNLAVDVPLAVFGTGADIGYLIKARAAGGNPSAYLQLQTGGSDANASAGFSYEQRQNYWAAFNRKPQVERPPLWNPLLKQDPDDLE